MMYGNIDLNCNVHKYIHSETSFNHILKFAWKTRCGTIIKINWIPRHLPRAFHRAHCDARALNHQMLLVASAWQGPLVHRIKFERQTPGFEVRSAAHSGIQITSFSGIPLTKKLETPHCAVGIWIPNRLVWYGYFVRQKRVFELALHIPASQ